MHAKKHGADSTSGMAHQHLSSLQPTVHQSGMLIMHTCGTVPIGIIWAQAALDQTASAKHSAAPKCAAACARSPRQQRYPCCDVATQHNSSACAEPLHWLLCSV
jgi:hypothetical protein